MIIIDYARLDDNDKANLADELLEARNVLNSVLDQAALGGIIVGLSIGERPSTRAADGRKVRFLAASPTVSPGRADPPLIPDTVEDLIADVEAGIRLLNRLIEAADLSGVPLQLDLMRCRMIGAIRQDVGGHDLANAMPEIEGKAASLRKFEIGRLLNAMTTASMALHASQPERGSLAMTAMHQVDFLLRENRIEVEAPLGATIQ